MNDDKKIKVLGHGKICLLFYINQEFRAANILADILFLEMKKNPDFKLRIPICCEVEYKGFKALVSVIPLNKSSEE